MKKKIVIIGNSLKFIKILKELYPNFEIIVYHWRSNLNIHLQKKLVKKPDIIFICGYNYESQWYAYSKYYHSNITAPLKLANFLIKKSTKILYVNTLNKIKRNNLSMQKKTLSRYQYAKQELAYRLYNKFKSVKILEIPVIKNKKNNSNIHGGIITKMLFNLLIYLKLINSINNNGIKKLIMNKDNNKNLTTPRKPKSIFLGIPRSLLLDRILRIISD
jgi:hypothetical protein|tara:strand:- start:4594 stop:5247 length:654 start_codon:yes stop_codon:yes gene_type:complete